MPFYGILEILQNMTYKNCEPIYLGSLYSIMNCGTISMGTRNTSMCTIIKGIKTPIMHLMDNCHFKWLTIYKTHTNVA